MPGKGHQSDFYRVTYASAVCSHRNYVRPFVRLSQVKSYTKVTKPRITQITPYDSTGTPVFWRQKSQRHFNDITPTGAPNRGREVQIDAFGPICRYISETLRDRDYWYGRL